MTRGLSSAEASSDEYVTEEEGGGSDTSTSQQVMNLMVQSRSNVLEKKPLNNNNKKVKINESANQVEGEEVSSISPVATKATKSEEEQQQQYMTMEAAIQLMNKEILNKTDEIYKQMKRIDINKDQITNYKESLLNMQKQMEFIQVTLSTVKTDHIGDMLKHEANARKNLEILKEHRKKNVLLKGRFDKYRKVISIESRLMEVRKKIDLAVKRDEMWGFIHGYAFYSGLYSAFFV